jgi:hypothetical protein
MTDNRGASAKADRAAGLRPQPPAASSQSSIPCAAWVEHVAQALYAQRPFVMASTATTFGHQVAKAFDWDGAPAYYQEDMRQLARAAVNALIVPGEAALCLSWRPDGGLRVYSPSHPGLLLSHSRPDMVMLDVLPVLAVMGFSPPASGTLLREDAPQSAAEGEA